MVEGLEMALVGIDGSRWQVHGAGQGAQGAWLGAEQVQAIYDAPIDVQWTETAGGRGARPRRRRYPARDMVLGFHVNDEDQGPAGRRGAALALALGSEPYRWDPDRRLARMEITSELSGMRWLDFEATAAPDLVAALDPLAQRYSNTVFSLRAGEPLFASEPGLAVFETPLSAASGTVVLANPSNTPCEYTVELTPGIWTIPDVSWSGPAGQVAPGGKHAGRTITVEVLPEHVLARLTRDRTQIPATAAGGANLVARQRGQFLQFDLPAWLPPTELPVSVTGAPAGGARAEWTLPQFWTRPWGMAWADRLSQEVGL